MYNLPYFKEKDDAVVMQFIKDHPFALITGVDAHYKPVATQIPVFMDERDGKLFLSGHIMRNTDHHKAFEQNPAVLAVFTGAHTYVSATWYDNPHQASTWNYMSVYASGIIRFGDEKELVEILKRLTLYYENGNTQATTVYNNLSEEYTGKLLNAIVAFEVEITSLDNVFKLSQNRDEKSYQNIIEELSKQGHDGMIIAGEMKKRASQLFNQ